MCSFKSANTDTIAGLPISSLATSVKPTSVHKWANGSPGSPSQLSTAPCTPEFWPLGGIEEASIDDFALCERDASYDELPPPATSSGSLGTALVQQEEDEDEDDYNFGSVSDNDGLHSEAEAEGVEASSGLVEALSIGLMPMESELGRWAERIVKADDWMQEQRRSHGLPELSLPMLPVVVAESQASPDVMSLPFKAASRRRTLRRRAARRRAAVVRQEEEEEFGSVSDNDGLEPEDEEEFGSVSDNDGQEEEEKEAAPDLVGALALGLALMQSELGLWAERMAKAEEWMQEKRREKGLPELGLPLAVV